MNNDITIDKVFFYFKNILDIPDYYCFYNNPNNISIYDFELYAHINNIKIYIISPKYQLFNLSSTVNSRIIFKSDNDIYEFLISIDDYTMLIIDDLIKFFGGKIL